MRRLIYHLKARFEVLEVVEHYEREASNEVADRFTAELRHCIERIAGQADSYMRRRGGIRRINLDRFPYHILFRIIDDETVKIISVKHDRRRPGYGTRRT